jgi:hypothetical protein
LGVDTEAMQADGKVDIGDSMPPVTDAILTIGHPMPGTRPIPTLKSNGIVIGWRHSPKAPGLNILLAFSLPFLNKHFKSVDQIQNKHIAILLYYQFIFKTKQSKAFKTNTI